MASYVIRHGRKSVASHKFSFHANFCRITQVTRGGRAQVVGRSLIAAKHHRSVGAGRKCIAAVRPWLWFWGPSLCQMTCEGRELACLSWCGRKPPLILGQFYTFCLLVCQSLPDNDVNASLRSDDKSLTTAHESKKSINFQLINRSQVGRGWCKPSITWSQVFILLIFSIILHYNLGQLTKGQLLFSSAIPTTTKKTGDERLCQLTCGCAKPLPEPILTSYELDFLEQTWIRTRQSVVEMLSTVSFAKCCLFL